MAGMPSGTVIASESELVRYAVQHALHSALFRVFGSDDVHGVELGGALKISMQLPWVWAQLINIGETPKV